MKRGHVLRIVLVSLFLPFITNADEPVARISFRVTDDAGSIVTGAAVSASTYLRSNWSHGTGPGYDEDYTVRGVTDTNGMVTLTLPSKRGHVRYAIVPDDEDFARTYKMMVAGALCYQDFGGEVTFTNHLDGKWMPSDVSVDMVIRRVRNPIPMYARRLNPGATRIPVLNTPVGYDLMKADWVAPHGDGVVSDFIITLECTLGDLTQDKVQYFDAILRLAFPNEGDGITEARAPFRRGSVMVLPSAAPEDGYRSSWTQSAFEHKDASRYEWDEQQNFLFRTRTHKDVNGNVVSALYGKIRGPILFGVYSSGAKISFTYYLNPTPNDRNLEFDPSRNLFTDLDPAERVKDP